MVRRSAPFRGRWRIVSMAMFTDEDLELLGAAFLEVGPRQHGALQFGSIRGEIDYRVSTRDGPYLLEFSWEGDSEGDRLSGRGWAQIHGATLSGHIYVHNGDDSHFVAEKVDVDF